MKRDDLIHSVISGNKWRKLKYLIEDAKKKGCKTLISMGGNHSNHLHALAFAGKELGFNTIGFVRGHKKQKPTPTLHDCEQWGMNFRFFDRVKYSKLRENLAWDSFQKECPNSYWVGEGGFSELAIKGVREVGKEVSIYYDYIFCGVGSGTTLIGLALAFPESKVIGVAAFKGAEYLRKQLEQQFPEISNWQLLTDYHFGGFAKTSRELDTLSNEFKETNGFELDKVYNSKVFAALLDLLEKDYFEKDSRVLIINTGGLQGNRN